MPEQPMFDYNGFAAYCADKEKWDKDRALRVAYEWHQQAEWINLALQQLMSQNVTLAATNNHLIELLEQLDALHRIAPQVLANYKSLRMDEMRYGEAIIRQGMEKNASLAATTAVSKHQSHSASGPRNRSDLARDKTIKAMRRWRRRPGVTLPEFIAAHADSVTGVRISNPTPNNGERYTVAYCDDFGEKVASKTVPWGTLRHWWGVADKPPKPKPKPKPTRR